VHVVQLRLFVSLWAIVIIIIIIITPITITIIIIIKFTGILLSLQLAIEIIYI
jgi:hypothetical protein